MMSGAVTVVVHGRGSPIKTLPSEIHIARNASTQQLYKSLATASRFPVHRLRITTGNSGTLLPSSPSLTIDEIGLPEKPFLHVKDLGPQISWRTVFLAEYLGPVFIPGLMLLPLRSYLHPHSTLPDPTQSQLALCILLTLHFTKREYETIFIHRFSNATMPLRNLFKNTVYYWVTVANMSYWVFHPRIHVSTPSNLFYPGLVLFIFGELANLNTHLVLRDLRPMGTRERNIPDGFGFGTLTCPNYWFEIIAWVGMYLVSGGSWSILLPTAIGTLQMAVWARKKERRYREEFGTRYKRKRFVLIPGVV